LSKRPVSNKYHLEGLQESTLLDFPSNIFYQALEYLIAIKLANKTGQSNDLLNAGYSDYLNQYMASIEPQETIKIQNCYSGGNRWSLLQ